MRQRSREVGCADLNVLEGGHADGLPAVRHRAAGAAGHGARRLSSCWTGRRYVCVRADDIEVIGTALGTARAGDRRARIGAAQGATADTVRGWLRLPAETEMPPRNARGWAGSATLASALPKSPSRRWVMCSTRPVRRVPPSPGTASLADLRLLWRRLNLALPPHASVRRLIIPHSQGTGARSPAARRHDECEPSVTRPTYPVSRAHHECRLRTHFW